MALAGFGDEQGICVTYSVTFQRRAVLSNPDPSSGLCIPCHGQFLPKSSQIRSELVLQLLLIALAPGKQFGPSTRVVSLRDLKYKHPQCNFWQRPSFWLQMYQQDLSFPLAAFPCPRPHQTLKCSSIILGYPQNN